MTTDKDAALVEEMILVIKYTFNGEATGNYEEMALAAIHAYRQHLRDMGWLEMATEFHGDKYKDTRSKRDKLAEAVREELS